jgi:hypothetical protein
MKRMVKNHTSSINCISCFAFSSEERTVVEAEEPEGMVQEDKAVRVLDADGTGVVGEDSEEMVEEDTEEREVVEVFIRRLAFDSVVMRAFLLETYASSCCLCSGSLKAA